MKAVFSVNQTSLGYLLVASSNIGVYSVLWGDSKEDLIDKFRGESHYINPELIDINNHVNSLKINSFIRNPSQVPDLKLDIIGTSFQKKVWLALKEVPVGHTTTYTEIAERIGNIRAIRAVAMACSSNKIAVAIPCHRITLANGKLAKYKWGLERKLALLIQERS